MIASSPLYALHATCIFFCHQVLILFWTHLPCFFSILSVCMPGLFCSAAFWLVRIAYCGKLGQGHRKKNRAIKQFRNRAISNRDFISISINRTALVWCERTFRVKKRTFILTGSSEELCVSVYLTMVFSNKMMKGLLIVLSVSEGLSSDNTWAAPARTLEYVVHDTTPLTQRTTQNKRIQFLYSSVFFALIKITDTRPCSDLTALFLIYSSIHQTWFLWHLHSKFIVMTGFWDSLHITEIIRL